MNIEDLLIEGAMELGIKLDGEQTRKFLKYMELIIDWNKKLNLTSVTEPGEIVIKHFLDSLTVCPLIDSNSQVLDIGTGAGFPGIPLSIVNDSIKVTLLDATEKKVFFLNHVLRELGLDNVITYHSRAEDMNNRVPRNNFNYVITRAVGDLEEVAALSSPYTTDDGKIILMRGKEGLKELGKFKSEILEIEEIKEVNVPKSDFKRVLVVLKNKM